MLRQEVMRAESPSEASLKRFKQFFCLLHLRSHVRQLGADPGTWTGPPQAWSPPFFEALLNASRGREPRAVSLKTRAPSDLASIRSEFTLLFGDELRIETTHVPQPGTRFSMQVVHCAGCGRRRLMAWAQWVEVDLALAALGRDALLAINSGCCPTCKVRGVTPEAVWISEPPLRTDPLLALTCVWVMGVDVVGVQTPPGTQPDEDNDRVLEIRAQEVLEGEKLGGPSSSMLTVAIIYSWEELVANLDRKGGQDRLDAHEALVTDLARKLKEGLISTAEVEDHLRSLPAEMLSDWEPRLELYPKGNHPLRQFVTSIVNEVIAAGQRRPAGHRALLAGATAQAHLALDQVALAEKALARARDLVLLIDHPATRMNIEASLALDATAIRKRGGRLPANGPADPKRLLGGDAAGTRLGRIGRLELRNHLALSLSNSGEPERAIVEFLECIRLSEVELADITGDEDEEAQRFTEILNSILSGVYSNLAKLIARAAGVLKSKAPLPLTLVAKLEEIVGRPVTTGSLRERAVALTERALSLSERAAAWEFAAIQRYNLALYREELGQGEAARQELERAARHAEGVPGHFMATEIHRALALRVQERGSGARAQVSWRAAVASEMRRVLEHAGERKPMEEQAMADAILGTTLVGGEPTTALLLVEGLRGLTTAASVSRGTTDRAVPEVLRRRRDDLLREREQLRLQLARERKRTRVREKLAAVEQTLAHARSEISVRGEALGRWTRATGIEPPDLELARRALVRLGPNSTLLGMIPADPDGMWVYALWDGGSVVRRCARPPRIAGEDRRTKLDRLGTTLLTPVAEALDRVKETDRIVFTGPSQLPMPGLSFRGRPLCCQGTLSFVRSLSLLLAVLSRPIIPLRRAICVGDPARVDLPHLKGARREALRVADLFGGRATTLLGNKATIRALKADAGSDILHFACHASAPRGDGHQGTLLLAPDRAVDSGDLSEDRILDELPVKPGAFVNLAACVTAAHEDRSGFVEGGLVSAFLAAGARAVLATAWPLRDAPAARFQHAFYKHLRAGASPASSLVAVQRACIDGALGADMRDPAVWAGYHLFGLG
jgi:hypothetical protein